MDPLIKAADPRHADYQSNVAMALAKRVGMPPREVAARIVANLEIGGCVRDADGRGAGIYQSAVEEGVSGAGAGGGVWRRRGGQGVERVAEAADGGDRLLAGRTWPSRCMWGICGRRFLATRWRGCWSSWGTGGAAESHRGFWHAVWDADSSHARTEGLGARAVLTIEDLDRYYKEATGKFKVGQGVCGAGARRWWNCRRAGTEAVAMWNRMRVATHAALHGDLWAAECDADG